MKKFTLKAITLAAASICGTAAFAGSIVAPATTGKYAVESLVAGTDITLPNIVYRMGVDRTVAQDFTVIITPTAGSAFTAGSCTAAIPTILLTTIGGTGPTGALSATVKRASATECAYEIDVTTAFVRAAGANTGTIDLVFAGMVLDSHGLATVGNTESITIALKDLGETAFIDNSGSLSANVATSGNALTLVAAADTATQADVNDELGPLFGFVTVGDDADALAKAAFIVRNNNDGTNDWKKPDGTTSWNFVVDGTSIAVTVAGNFQGLAASGFLATTGVGVAPTVTATAAGTTATYSLAPTNVTGAGTNTTVTNTFTSARTASLGTSRVFGVSAVGDVVTGANVALAGNSTWWTWGANASQLMTPYFTTNTLFLTRFFFLNESTAAVTYSADCYSEAGNAITYGAARTGTLSASGQTAVNALSVCTFSGNTRGSIIFTINAPIQSVKGSYQAVDPVSLNNSVTPLTRRYGTGLTTE